MTHSPSSHETTVLVLSRIAQDRTMVMRVLSHAGFSCRAFSRAAELLQVFEAEGGGMLLLCVEALAIRSEADSVLSLLNSQPAWSDVPVVILTNRKVVSVLELKRLKTFKEVPSVTFMDKPVKISGLLSLIGASITSRKRQYQVRQLLRTAEAGVRQRDEFLAMLSHELRNPLAAICSATEVQRLHPEKVSQTTPILLHQARHVKIMVDDLLDVARITTGKVSLRHETLDVKGLLHLAASSMEAEIREKGHKFTMEEPSSPVLVRGDSVRLVQVFNNLISNAVKYTPPGGSILARVGVEGERAVIALKDNGLGMDADTQKHIFDLFVQGRRDIARSEGGLGIGLTITRQIVEMHAGSVAVESDGPQRGSTFTVSLPLSEPAGEARSRQVAVAEAMEAAGKVPRLKILIVDDNRSAADATAMLVEALGHDAQTLYDGHAACAHARLYQPDLVLLDLGMPGINGFEVASALQELPNRKDMVIVALTGYGDEDTVAKVLQSGFDHHLLKPADLKSILRLLAGMGWGTMEAQGP